MLLLLEFVLCHPWKAGGRLRDGVIRTAAPQRDKERARAREREMSRTAVPTAGAAAWERAASDRTVLALPADAAAVVAPASMPYAIELCSVSGAASMGAVGDGTFSARVSLYDKGSKSIFWRMLSTQSCLCLLPAISAVI